MSAPETFRDAMQAAGLAYGGPLVPDGLLHRFKAAGDKERNSWFVLHAGPPAAGAFGCWKRSLKEAWCDRNGQLSQDEWNHVRERWNEAERARERTEIERHAKARTLATWILNRSRPARTLHRYLSRKGAPVFGDLREWRSAVVLPLRDTCGDLHSLQFIGEDGSKRFLRGSRIAGCSFTIGDKPDGPLVLCEGYATGASVHEATGFAVVCAMHAGNLKAVAGSLREKHPNREIIIAADNDQFTDGNPGLTKATEAAKINRAKLAVPQFQDITAKPTDFNDVHQLAGLAEVAQQIQSALAAAQPVAVSPMPDLHAAPPRHVSKPAITLPEDDEGDDIDETQLFPLESLAPPLASIVAAVSRCERVPAALPAVCALGVASAAIGTGLEIVSAPDRVTRANLFLLADAESGSGKSQVWRRIAEPIVEHQHQLHEIHSQKTAPQLVSELAVLTREANNLERKAAKATDPAERERLLGELEYRNARRAELQQKIAPPCVICGDVTSEKLAVLLAMNRETLFSGSPEARQILDIICGRYSSTKSTDEAIYLSGFSGDFLRVDRLGRDPLTLRRPCLSVLWLVQPDAMARLFDEETLAQSGFLPRFLICHTQATPRKILDDEAHAISDTIRAQWSALLASLLATYHAADKPFRIEPTPEAKRLLNDFFNVIVDRRGDDLADVGQFAARYGEQAWRVALVLHAAFHGVDAHNHPLPAETAAHAIAIVRWFVDSQLSVMARTRRQAVAKLEDEVLELLESNRQRKAQDFITAREVQRARIVTTADAARALLDRMEKDGLLVGENITPQGGGKTTRIFRRVPNPVPE